MDEKARFVLQVPTALLVRRIVRRVADLHRGEIGVWVLWRHAHGRVDWRRRRRTVRRACRAGIVLAATPAETHTRVANRVALHLVDGHLSGVALNKLDESTALAWWNLNVGNLAEALEERSELVLGDVAG